MSDQTDETMQPYYVPCEACGVYVPSTLATFEHQSGGHLCDGCVRVLAALIGSKNPL